MRKQVGEKRVLEELGLGPDPAIVESSGKLQAVCGVTKEMLLHCYLQSVAFRTGAARYCKMAIIQQIAFFLEKEEARLSTH